MKWALWLKREKNKAVLIHTAIYFFIVYFKIGFSCEAFVERKKSVFKKVFLLKLAIQTILKII